jgi:hypothetical protein
MQRLLSALCDGELTEADGVRLKAALSGDREARRLYFEYLDMHAHLLTHPNLGPPQVAGGSGDRGNGQPLLAHGRQHRRVLGYALVAMATLAASLAVQVIWWHPQSAEPPGGRRGATDVVAPGKVDVATLTQSADCVWEQPQQRSRGGQRLGPGELQLKQGVARIHFDGGSDLVVQGPVKLRVDSATAATVMQGKVVFRADETAVPFDLHTPCSTVVDLGAEYAVAVGESSEEIHVFDGEVRRSPKAVDSAEPERLSAGEARSYGPAPDSPGRPAQYDPTQFVRQLSNLDDLPPDQAAGLLCYEGFDYASPDLLRTGKANGGVGWTSPWTPGFARPLVEGDKNYLALNVKDSLSRRDAKVPSVGGAFEYVGFAKYHRRMGIPLRMDSDGVYYLSFLFRRLGPPEDALNAVAILFRTTEELQRGKEDSRKRLNVGVGGWNQLFTHLGGVGSRTPVPLRFGETYLLVAKIVTSKSGSDQVFMRVYSPEEPVEREEAGGWTVTGPALQSDLTFDWMEIHINSKTRQTIDEIRLGTTWSAVTDAWQGGPKQK